jgi:hypothetical protein
MLNRKWLKNKKDKKKYNKKKKKRLINARRLRL